MGSWGTGSFDNDAALDWIGDFVDDPKPKVVDSAFRAVLEAKGYIDVPACEQGIAAAELVAALAGKPSDELPENARYFLEGFSVKATPELKKLALNTTRRIQQEGELRELWEEGGDLDSWLEAVEDLISRLQ